MLSIPRSRRRHSGKKMNPYKSGTLDTPSPNVKEETKHLKIFGFSELVNSEAAVVDAITGLLCARPGRGGTYVTPAGDVIELDMSVEDAAKLVISAGLV